jgi:hypothetical protein
MDAREAIVAVVDRVFRRTLVSVAGGSPATLTVQP